MSGNVTPSQYVSVRYGRNTNSQVYKASPVPSPRTGATAPTVQLDQPESQRVLGGSKLNEFIFSTRISRTTSPRALTRRSRHSRTASRLVTTPIRRRRRLKRSTSSATTSHGTSAGWAVSATTSRRAPISSRAEAVRHVQLGQRRLCVHAPDQQPHRPISTVTRNKPAPRPPADGSVRLLHPGRLARDRSADDQRRPALRPRHRLPDRSVQIPNFIALTGAAAAGRFNGVAGFDEFGKKAQEDKNTGSRALASCSTCGGDGRDIVRTGGHLLLRVHHANICSRLERAGRFGRHLHGDQHLRSAESRRQLLRGGPAHCQHRAPERGESQRAVLQHQRAAPQFVNRYDADIGGMVNHQLGAAMVFDVDYVHVEARTLAYAGR